MKTTWTHTLALATCAAGIASAVTSCGSNSTSTKTCSTLPKLESKTKYNIGYSQKGTEGANNFRIAESQSMQSAAADLGYNLTYTDAAQVAATQQSQIASMIDSKLDAIFMSPFDGSFGPSVIAAREACIPVFLVDTSVTGAVAGQDYVTFVGHDQTQQGNLAANWLMQNRPAGSDLLILELLGVPGAGATVNRDKAFRAAIAGQANVTLQGNVTGSWVRTTARTAIAPLLAQYPNTNAIYAQNDEMALGAMDAIMQDNAAPGKIAGKDILIIGNDGETTALQAIVNLNQNPNGGGINASVSGSPRFGPVALAQMQNYALTGNVPTTTYLYDSVLVFDQNNAQANLPDSF